MYGQRIGRGCKSVVVAVMRIGAGRWTHSLFPSFHHSHFFSGTTNPLCRGKNTRRVSALHTTCKRVRAHANTAQNTRLILTHTNTHQHKAHKHKCTWNSSHTRGNKHRKHQVHSFGHQHIEHHTRQPAHVERRTTWTEDETSSKRAQHSTAAPIGDDG